jgi:hypothetical protein
MTTISEELFDGALVFGSLGASEKIQMSQLGKRSGYGDLVSR